MPGKAAICLTDAHTPQLAAKFLRFFSRFCEYLYKDDANLLVFVLSCSGVAVSYASVDARKLFQRVYVVQFMVSFIKMMPEPALPFGKLSVFQYLEKVKPVSMFQDQDR
ncbi:MULTISPECIES: hypothetical protein [Acetobacter]|uniref:hypothetical protein n=1 Tax=Acetobacter TaxID=434 RepID=UPI000A398649|nr:MULTISPECIES: hypothetical protein [Acetobacter]MBS0985216.1 hypothetical protein [Acetobacter thailandicus]OUI88891.1 hypothetical protein HK11_04335 [Acetobacter sp. DmW_043]OUJ11143.1 hypothetical protein HK25_02500 [Acetobacter sp. DsW_059]